MSTTNKIYPPPTSQDMMNMRIRQKEQEEFYQKLVENGHQCITILDTCPMNINWCQNEPCSGPRLSP